jgi:uncharacterized protein (TIGR00297 family)
MDLTLGCTIALALTLLAWAVRAVTISGALVGFLMAVAFATSPTPNLFGLFVLFVVGGSVASRLGRAWKVERGLAQSSGGRRSGWHAIANAGPGLLFLQIGVNGPPEHLSLCLLAAAASLTAMLSDTVAGELGAWLGGTPRMILTGRKAEAGTNGAVSFVGLLAGALAASAGAWVSVAGTACALPQAGVIASAAMIGNLADSVLGQVVEPRLGKHGGFMVNTGAAMIAGLAAMVLDQMR